MVKVASAAKDSLPSTAFDYQPTPILILSDDFTVLLVNTACQRIFRQSSSLVDKSVKDLPIHWKDGPSDAFHSLLCQPFDDWQVSHRTEPGTPLLRLQVETSKHGAASVMTACLLVTNFECAEKHLRMLTFENIQGGASVIQSSELDSKGAASCHSDGTSPTSSRKGNTYSTSQEADFRDLCDRLPHLLWTVNTNGEADYFSPSWYDFTGFTEEQSLGLSFTDAIDPKDMKNIWAKFAEAGADNHEVHVEAKYRRFDGEWIWMYVRAKPLVDSSGNVVKWYGTSTDIHTLVLERTEAQRMKVQMMDMLQFCSISLFEVSSEAQFNVIEGRMEWLSDLKPPRRLTDLDEKQGTAIAKFKNVLPEVTKGTRETAVFEGQIKSRWYSFRLVRDGYDEEGHRQAYKALGCSIDITEHKERAGLELDNARLVNEAALEMSKSRLKNAFLAHMSHEIRTPIAGIIGLADMLDDLCHDSEQHDCIEDLKRSADNLLTIVNDILDLSKIESGQLKFEKVQFDINSLANEVRSLFHHNARNKSLDLTCRLGEPGERQIIGDPGRVKQILSNLVSNALKFTTEGSINMSVTPEGPNIRIEVQDSGEGIEKETFANLFKPFVQADNSTARRHGGTGLGLVISRNLAERMGGRLTLESIPGNGTNAILILPKEAGFDNSTSPPDQEKNPLATEIPIRTPMFDSSPNDQDVSSRERLILIVEDNAINQKVALNLVKKLGFQAKAVWNGQEALDFLENQDDPESGPDLILMDCQMPHLDGYEATRRLKNDKRYLKDRAVPVIALTASAIQGDREKAQSAGFDDYLAKPVSRAVLQVMFNKWIPTTG